MINRVLQFKTEQPHHSRNEKLGIMYCFFFNCEKIKILLCSTTELQLISQLNRFCDMISAGQTGRSRDTSGSVWWTSMRPLRGSSAPVVAVSGGGSSSSGDMFVAILLGCTGAFVVIIVVIGIIFVLRWHSKRSPVERSPLKSSSLSNTRCTNFSLNYLNPSPAPVSYSATAKVIIIIIKISSVWN